jgi:hypothetical protein
VKTLQAGAHAAHAHPQPVLLHAGHVKAHPVVAHPQLQQLWLGLQQFHAHLGGAAA